MRKRSALTPLREILRPLMPARDARATLPNDAPAVKPTLGYARRPAPHRESRMESPAPTSPSASLELLRRLVEEISGELEFEPLLARIIEYACTLLGADDGSIGLYDAERDLIRTAAAFNMPPRELGAEMRPGVGLAGHVLATGRAVLARYGDLERITLPELADNCVIGVPIRWKDELIGVFGIGVAAPRRFDQGALDTLSVFARHAAIAIENARRYARERRRTARFELIARVSKLINGGLGLDRMLQQAADAIHDVLEFPNVDIPLLDPDDPQTLVITVRGGDYKRLIQGQDRVPIARGIMGAAVREKRSQRVDDVASDPRYVQPPTVTRVRAELAVPILSSGEVLGVVNVEGEHAFDDLDQRTIEIIADHLAIAIHNARLIEHNRAAAVWQERQRLRRELHDSVTQILSSISLLAQALPSAWRASPQDGEKRAARLAELAQTAFAEMRALLRELQPPAEAGPAISRRGRSFLGLERLKDGGLAPALTRLLDTMIPETLARRYDFAAWVPQHLPHEEALYRVCQEAISNVIRHSGAHHVEIEARCDARLARLIVRDDGGGLVDDSASGGIGLKSMQQRVASLGGTFRLRRVDPRGLEVEACIPRHDRKLETPAT
jgi:two-component system, NarL family, sensor kinase